MIFSSINDILKSNDHMWKIKLSKHNTRIFQRVHTSSQCMDENILNTTSYLENANQKLNELPSYTHENSYHQKDRK